MIDPRNCESRTESRGENSTVRKINTKKHYCTWKEKRTKALLVLFSDINNNKKGIRKRGRVNLAQ